MLIQMYLIANATTLRNRILKIPTIANSCSRFTTSKIEPLARLQVSKMVSRRRF